MHRANSAWWARTPATERGLLIVDAPAVKASPLGREHDGFRRDAGARVPDQRVLAVNQHGTAEGEVVGVLARLRHAQSRVHLHEKKLHACVGGSRSGCFIFGG